MMRLIMRLSTQKGRIDDLLQQEPPVGSVWSTAGTSTHAAIYVPADLPFHSLHMRRQVLVLLDVV